MVLLYTTHPLVLMAYAFALGIGAGVALSMHVRIRSASWFAAHSLKDVRCTTCARSLLSGK